MQLLDSISTATHVHPVGSRPIGQANFKGGNLSGISLAIARCTSADPNIFPDQSTKLKVDVQAEINGSWTSLGSVTAEGGILINSMTQEEVTHTNLRTWWPWYVVPTRVRVVETVTGGNVRTNYTVNYYRLDVGEEPPRLN